MSALKMVAELMEVAARTAPKARGQDYITTRILEGDDLVTLAETMARIGEETGRAALVRDSKNVTASEVVLLIGLQAAEKAQLDCGACGQPTCADLNTNTYAGEFRGPQCAFRLIDLGIAVGSAVKTAASLNADNRIMYTVGLAVRQAGLIDADVVVGIPLSATGKSIYFDRR